MPGILRVCVNVNSHVYSLEEPACLCSFSRCVPRGFLESTAADNLEPTVQVRTSGLTQSAPL